MTVSELKPGDRFIKWDGAECELVEKTDGRARIKILNKPKARKSFDVQEDDGTVKHVEFETVGRAEFDVALGTEVLEVL